MPSTFNQVKSFKTFDDLSHYILTITGDFAIHLVTINHVVAIYRIGDTYAYFDTNVAFVANLKTVQQLMKVVNKVVTFAGYQLAEEGLLVEQFDVVKANQAITQKQVLVTPIQTERYLLSLQDKKLGPISLNGQELSRVMLYDLGTKLHLEDKAGIYSLKSTLMSTHI